MLTALLQAAAAFGPIIFLLLFPILIPIFTLSIGAFADRLRAKK